MAYHAVLNISLIFDIKYKFTALFKITMSQEENKYYKE